MSYKKIVWLYFLSGFTSLLFFSSYIFVLDPLKIFHKPYFFKDYLQPNMRDQALGIIRNYDFDGIIMGASVLMNTSSKEAAEKLEGDKFFNLSMAGSDLFERSLVLGYALKHKKIATVIYALNDTNLYYDSKGNKSFNPWLYDDNSYVRFAKIYFNQKYLSCIFTFSCMGRKVDLDRPKAWHKSEEISELFGGFDKWLAKKNNNLVKSDLSLILQSARNIKEGKSKEINEFELLKEYEDLKKYLNETIIKNVANHKDTDFILTATPHSRINYAILAQDSKKDFALYNMSLNYLVSMSEQYPNMKIYAWGNESFLDDIANYSDLGHFDPEYNSYMLDQIQKENGLLTTANVDDYLKTFTQKAMEYDLVALADTIESYYNKN